MVEVKSVDNVTFDDDILNVCINQYLLMLIITPLPQYQIVNLNVQIIVAISQY